MEGRMEDRGCGLERRRWKKEQRRCCGMQGVENWYEMDGWMNIQNDSFRLIG